MTLSRRYLRLFLAVFLVVFLAGTGVSGAWALWSQKASTVATVQTGSWTVRAEGFPMPLTHRVVSGSMGKRSAEATLSWSPANPADAELDVIVDVRVESLSSRGRVNEVRVLDRSSTGSVYGRISTTGGEWDEERFRIVLTPVLDGVRGRPTYINYEMPDD